MKKMIRVLSAITAILCAGCTTTGAYQIKDLKGKIEAENSIALIESSQRTDQFLKEVFKQTNVMFIVDGRGGELDGMLDTLEYLDSHPEKLVVIDGACYSACTLLLSRPRNVVFTENATFLFHSASSSVCRDRKIQTSLSEDGNKKMRKVLPKPVVRWVEKRKAFSSTKFTRMEAHEAMQMLPNMFVHSEDLPMLERTGETLSTMDTSNLNQMIAACK